MLTAGKSIGETRELIKDILRIESISFEMAFTTLEQIDQENYRELLIEYHGYEGDAVRAYLLVPHGEGPFPAVLVHHQHNSEWHLGKSEVCGLKGDPFNAFGPALADRGILVMAPDSVGFEDRRRNQTGTVKNAETDWLQYYNGMAYRLVSGHLLLTTVLHDALIATSILGSHPEVDQDRLGIMGHSYGGSIALFHGAIDERVSFVCSSGAACSYANKMQYEMGFEMSLVVPGITKVLDVPDVLKCIVPRRTLLLSAIDDDYSKDADQIVQEINTAFRSSAQTHAIEHLRYRGRHALTKERFDQMMDWMRRTAFRML